MNDTKENPMGPEMHYELIVARVNEMHEAAAAHRLAREAQRGRVTEERPARRLTRSVFAKLRLS
jgi:hypothetical protein